MGRETADWVIVVDDDIINLKTAGYCLSEAGIRVTALQSGKALIEYLRKGEQPDLLLLDILMPETDGFETLKLVRQYEQNKGIKEIPVVFLTADENKETETRGFSLGAIDFIRKPFEPKVFLKRIQNILSYSRLINTLSEEAVLDKLTGLKNKIKVNSELEKACRECQGVLLVLDLDGFKLVNDIYGHEMGDKILVRFAELLKKNFRTNDIVGRIGGDEFVAFLKDVKDVKDVKRIIARLNEQLVESARSILSGDVRIPLGVSAGAVMTEEESDYYELFNKADKSLYFVKQNGKHDCEIYHECEEIDSALVGDRRTDLRSLSLILDERNIDDNALWLGNEAFGNVYRYMIRYLGRYHETACKVLISIDPVSDDMPAEEFREITDALGELLRSTLRNSDMMMQSSPGQFFLLLPTVTEDNFESVMSRLKSEWEKIEGHEKVKLSFETESVALENDQ